MNVIYRIVKENIMAASMLSFNGLLYEILDDLIAMIKSYNTNLTRSFLRAELLALRFFEQKNEDGTEGVLKVSPEIAEKSRKLIAEKISTFNLTPEEDTSDDLGIIALEDNDQVWIADRERQYVTINLDTNTVSFEGCLNIYSYNAYTNLGLCDISSLKNCDFNLENVKFNELEDLKNFVKENFSGWINENDPGIVFLPCRENS